MHYAKEPNDWTIVPGSSVGPIRLDMAVAEVEALLGKADERAAFEDECTVYLTYHRLGLCIRIVDDKVASVLVYSGREGGYETTGWTRFKGACACGLDFDVRAEEVTRRLGPAEKSGSLPGAPIPSSWISYTSRGVGFDFIQATGEMIYASIFVPRELSDVDNEHLDPE